MKLHTVGLLAGWVWLGLFGGGAWAAQVPAQGAVDGKYSGLLQVLNCPPDAASYGQFRDYGWWKGGPWCGQTGQPGFWVWVNPNWYIWSTIGDAPLPSGGDASRGKGASDKD